MNILFESIKKFNFVFGIFNFFFAFDLFGFSNLIRFNTHIIYVHNNSLIPRE